ncbi:hypothetical protein FDP41_009306 [Naegleria fowleri]|uniref:Uncharacterized protein n=1 Tax=Naegleria fowleri TaxID=5763 RepID=A0A6A5AXG6_NAEFO|nr:uncharacterized protein FDP41_009306 [Naegleria fowleri]KAF0972403.1 hypothetical protein FDP41_009306 [Naegleria fowleri]
MKKIKKSSLEESEEVKNLLDKISQHDDASPFKFATNEEERLFHSVISIEILTSQEDSRSMINEEIFDLPSQRIMTVYNEILLSQKSLPDNVWESTLMGMVVNILNHQFKLRENIIFGTSDAISFGYAIRESDIFNLSSTEGIIALTTFIESMCENVCNLGFNEEGFEESARLSSSSTPTRAKTQSLERIVKEMDVRFGTKMPSNIYTNAFETLEEGKRVSKKILSGIFAIGDQIGEDDADSSNIVYVFKTSNPYIFVRSFNITSFVGIFYWAETKFDLKSYLFSLSIKKNQEQLWMKILDEHRSDDSRSRSEHDESRRHFYNGHNQQSKGISFEPPFKFIPDPMNETRCAIVLEELLALTNFQFLPNSMRCDTSCTSFYGSAFSHLYGPVFVKGTVFRTENESVMKRLVTLSQTRSTFSNIVRVFVHGIVGIIALPEFLFINLQFRFSHVYMIAMFPTCFFLWLQVLAENHLISLFPYYLSNLFNFPFMASVVYTFGIPFVFAGTFYMVCQFKRRKCNYKLIATFNKLNNVRVHTSSI